MRLIAILASGVSLISLAVCARLTQAWYATSRPPPPSFISLPQGMLLCVEGRLPQGWRIISCTPVDGLTPTGGQPHIESFSAPTSPMSSVNGSSADNL